MMFEVRANAQADRIDHAPIVKGTVEVIRIIDSHTSELRILGITYDGPNGIAKDDVVIRIDPSRHIDAKKPKARRTDDVRGKAATPQPAVKTIRRDS